MSRPSELLLSSHVHRVKHRLYFLPKVEIKVYKVMIDSQNIFDQPVKNNVRTDENVGKNATGQRNDHTTAYLLDYSYFKENYN